MRYFCLLTLLIIFGDLSAQTWEPVGAGVTRSDTNYDAVMALYTFHNKLYIGGKFVYSGEKKVNSLASWNGIKIDTVGRGVDSIVSCFAEYKGELCIGGEFYKWTQDHKKSANIVLWNDSTGVWSFLDGGLGGYRLQSIRTINIYKGELYAAGAHTGWEAEDYSITPAKWSGDKWGPLCEKPKTCNLTDLGQNITSSTIYNGKIYMGYELPISDEVNSVVSWDGNQLIPLNRSLFINKNVSINVYPYRILVMTVYRGALYIGGFIRKGPGHSPVTSIIKWNDTTLTEVGNGVNGLVWSMAVYDGKLYVGGCFDSAGGKPANNIAVWDGKSWSAVGGGLVAKTKYDSKGHVTFRGRVAALAVYKNELYAGGTFDFSGTTQLCNLAKLKLDGHIAKPKSTGKRK